LEIGLKTCPGYPGNRTYLKERVENIKEILTRFDNIITDYMFTEYLVWDISELPVKFESGHTNPDLTISICDYEEILEINRAILGLINEYKDSVKDQAGDLNEIGDETSDEIEELLEERSSIIDSIIREELGENIANFLIGRKA